MTAFFKRLNDAGFLKFRRAFPDGLIPVIPTKEQSDFSLIDWQSMTEGQRALALEFFPGSCRENYDLKFAVTGLPIQNKWLFPSLEIDAMVAL